jgi:hypothetical protein
MFAEWMKEGRSRASSTVVIVKELRPFWGWE